MLKSVVLVFLWLFSQSIYSQKCKMEHSGKEREFIVHLPSEYNSSQKYPLVLSFHGLGGSPKQQRKYTQMNSVSDKEGFIVVYPKGENRFWNTGVGGKSYQYGRDDVGFVNTLLDKLIKDYPIDTMRIYSSGMSLGGYFSYRLACELGHRIAAIASVTGVLSDSTECRCKNPVNMPVLQIHGTKDPIVKYKGFRQSNSVDETIAFWVKQNTCLMPPDTLGLKDCCPTDKSTVSLIKYTSCKGNSEVWFYKISKGGHTWPGTRKDYIITGRINYDINGSEVVWDFLKKFSLQNRSGLILDDR